MPFTYPISFLKRTTVVTSEMLYIEAGNLTTKTVYSFDGTTFTNLGSYTVVSNGLRESIAVAMGKPYRATSSGIQVYNAGSWSAVSGSPAYQMIIKGDSSRLIARQVGSPYNVWSYNGTSWTSLGGKFGSLELIGGALYSCSNVSYSYHNGSTWVDVAINPNSQLNAINATFALYNNQLAYINTACDNGYDEGAGVVTTCAQYPLGTTSPTNVLLDYYDGDNTGGVSFSLASSLKESFGGYAAYCGLTSDGRKIHNGGANTTYTTLINTTGFPARHRVLAGKLYFYLDGTFTLYSISAVGGTPSAVSGSPSAITDIVK